MLTFPPPVRPISTALVAAVATVAAVAVTVPAAPAQAQSGCVMVQYEPTTWSTGPDEGGFVLNVRLSNLCDNAIDGWTVELRFASDRSVNQVWNAAVPNPSGRQLTFTDVGWNSLLTPTSSVSFGAIGQWSGEPSGPVSCQVNGEPCAAEPEPNQPPVVTVTSPMPGDIVVIPSIVTFQADASDPDGSIDRVEFHVENTPVQTDTTAPYTATLPYRMAFCGCSVFARAYDDGDPSLFTDSEVVTFQTVTVPPLAVIAEPAAVAVPAGGSAAFTVTIGAPTTADIEIVIDGDEGITAAPETFTLDASTWDTGQEVVVTAGAGTEGATATITAGTLGGSDTVAVTVVP